MGVRIPSPALVVLVGPSGAGKTTWASGRFAVEEIVSTDRMRAVVGRSERDQEASGDAFDLVHRIVDARCRRGLTTVVDSTGLDAESRGRWVAAALAHGLPAVAVVFAVDAATCRTRNRMRPLPVPARIVDRQVRTFAATVPLLVDEGFSVVEADDDLRVVPPAFATDPPPATATAPAPPARRLAFALQIPDFGAVGDRHELRRRLADIALAAEEVGFESLWVMDHLVQIPFVGRPWLDMLESYTTLAYLAGITDRIRLGTMVTGITFRNVAHLAKVIATLDVVSGGRAEAGIGAAWFAHEHHAYGYEFPSARDRLDLLEDALQLLPAMWGPGTKPFEGRVISLPETTCYPRPLQERIPLLVGGEGERRTLRLVARYADACNLRGDLASVRNKVQILHRHCDEVGRSRHEVRITHLGTALVAKDDVALRAAVDERRGRRSAPDYAGHVNAALVDDHIARFSHFREAGVGLCVVSLPDVGPAAIERFGRVIAAFA